MYGYQNTTTTPCAYTLTKYYLRYSPSGIDFLAPHIAVYIVVFHCSPGKFSIWRMAGL